jgi:hypothetical protein
MRTFPKKHRQYTERPCLVNKKSALARAGASTISTPGSHRAGADSGRAWEPPGALLPGSETRETRRYGGRNGGVDGTRTRDLLRDRQAF